MILGVTPERVGNGGRGEEISESLKDFPPDTRYVIIDDDVQDIKDVHPKNLVYVMGGWCGGHGMLKKHAKEAIRILEGK